LKCVDKRCPHFPGIASSEYCVREGESEELPITTSTIVCRCPNSRPVVL
jgi:hypothetical protein